MPVKILLADKSITIQKVVEMLFSGREYEVTCVSDGETALSDAVRVVPDVVLADVDLPRIDGYSFATRLKQTPALAQTPVILMMSRDDVYDEAKGRQAGIVGFIAKPFESQELIGKVKKALSAAPPRLVEPAPAVKPPQAATRVPPPVPPRPMPVPEAPRPVAPPTPKPKQAAPQDIWDIIEEAPTQAEIKKVSARPVDEESVFEVEPEVEVEEALAREATRALPVGDKAMEEMRAGLGLTEEKEKARPAAPRKPEAVAREWKPAPEPPPVQPAALSESALRSIAEETVARMAKEVFAKMPPVQAPKVSEETVRRGIEESVSKIAREVAREVIEKVAWEVIPPLAELLIKEEIERLKSEP